MECEPPDACTNDTRELRLLSRQDGTGKGAWQRFMDRERHLIIACAVIVLLMNFIEGRWILYPFMIFSTWIHEMCHGMAALLTGGSIARLQIFADGSGLAYTVTTTTNARAFVASAGYPGTAVTGCLMLLFRRTTLGPTIGTMTMGVLMLISCLLYVRNKFGLIALSIEGLLLVGGGWFAPAALLDHLYGFLSATCCLNAVESIHDLFGASQGYAGGQLMSSDAHTVAEYWGGDYRVWATIWFILALALTAVGIIFARDARALSCFRGDRSQAYANNNQYVNQQYAQATPMQPLPVATPVYAQPTAPPQPQHAVQIV